MNVVRSSALLGTRTHSRDRSIPPKVKQAKETAKRTAYNATIHSPLRMSDQFDSSSSTRLFRLLAIRLIEPKTRNRNKSNRFDDILDSD